MPKKHDASARSESVRIASSLNGGKAKVRGKLLITGATLSRLGRRCMAGLVSTLVITSGGVDATAQSLKPTIAEAVEGCWTKRSYTLGDNDYWSLCFAQDGTVTSTVISGSLDGGLSGTSSGGIYEIADDQIEFVFGAGDYGWLWEDGDVTCTLSFIETKRLDLTNCDDTHATVHFKRSRPEVE